MLTKVLAWKRVIRSEYSKDENALKADGSKRRRAAREDGSEGEVAVDAAIYQKDASETGPAPHRVASSGLDM